MMGQLQNIARSVDVAFDHLERIFHRVFDPEHGGQVEYDIAALYQAAQQIFIRHRSVDHRMAVVFRRFIQKLQFSGRHIVQRPNVMPLFEQPLHQMGADKAGAAGY